MIQQRHEDEARKVAVDFLMAGSELSRLVPLVAAALAKAEGGAA